MNLCKEAYLFFSILMLFFLITVQSTSTSALTDNSSGVTAGVESNPIKKSNQPEQNSDSGGGGGGSIGGEIRGVEHVSGYDSSEDSGSYNGDIVIMPVLDGKTLGAGGALAPIAVETINSKKENDSVSDLSKYYNDNEGKKSANVTGDTVLNSEAPEVNNTVSKQQVSVKKIDEHINNYEKDAEPVKEQASVEEESRPITIIDKVIEKTRLVFKKFFRWL